jgi:hypothetical protein
VRKDEYSAWFYNHVIRHVSIVTGQNEHGLFVGHSFADKVGVLCPVDLTRLERVEALGPGALVCVAHQIVEDVGGAAGLDQGSLDHRLQDRIGRADYAAPSGHLRYRQRGAPSKYRYQK